MAHRGKLFAIEGGDGSGKGTQAEITRLYISQQLGRAVMKEAFPRYGKKSAIFVEHYLNGKYSSDPMSIHPELAGLVFAVDRWAGTPEIKSWLDANPGGIAVLDRYIGSNLAHQGAKLDNSDERHAFYEEMQSYEYEVLDMLKPDKNVVLLVPSTIAQQNVNQKATRTYTMEKRDIHEGNAPYLDKVKFCYEELCELYPDQYTPINCIDEAGAMRSREEIQKDIRTVLGI